MTLLQVSPQIVRLDNADGGANLFKGTLPSGCAQCREGAKMVVFITGECSRKCYYCPLSEERWQHDVVLANETKIGLGEPDLDAIYAEAEAMRALGTGITGGDPMEKPQRCLTLIRGLKERFGPSHHVHLYTTGRFDPAYLQQLADAGLDELRYHPPFPIWDQMEGTGLAAHIAAAVEVGRHAPMRIGLEIPAIPKAEERTLALLRWATDTGLTYCNLNELEFSHTNYDRMTRMGQHLAGDSSNHALGSRSCAETILSRYVGPMTVHFCTSAYKDGVQLRQRFLRRAETIQRPHEEVTEDGTILLGVIEGVEPTLEALTAARNVLLEQHDVPEELVVIDLARMRLEVAWWVIEELADSLPWPCYLSEEHPTSQRFEVEREPLGKRALAAAMAAVPQWLREQ